MSVTTTHPPLGPLRTVMHALEQGGLAPALGGSGLLYAHGLAGDVRDWDVQVDADRAAVEAALTGAGLDWQAAGDRPGQSLTGAHLLVTADGVEIDVLVNVGVRSPATDPHAQVVRIPALPTGAWDDIPLGSLEAWLMAYRLLGQTGYAEAIGAHLWNRGANRIHLQRLLVEPLPAEIRAELDALLRRVPPDPRPIS